MKQTNGRPAADPFLDEYAKLLNGKLLPLVSNTPAAVRLNAAIVVARVAEAAPATPRLLPCVQALIQKNQPAGILVWGVRAGNAILVKALSTGNNAVAQQLLKDEVAVAQATNNTAVIQEVYNGLAAKPSPILTPALLELLTFRCGQFAGGVPEDPELESCPGGPLVVLTATQWRSLTAQQQLQVAQILSDMICLAAEQSANAPQNDFARFVQAVRTMADCVVVIGRSTGTAGLTKAGQDAGRINPVGATPDVLKAAVKNIPEELRKVPAFANLKDPPRPKSIAADPTGAI